MLIGLVKINPKSQVKREFQINYLTSCFNNQNFFRRNDELLLQNKLIKPGII